MTFLQKVITIALCSIATILTRFLPFIISPSGRKTPDFIQYLGKALPGAIFGMLILSEILRKLSAAGNH